MPPELKPDFERYLTTLHCEEPDRVPLGEWHVDAQPMEAYLGRPVKSLDDQTAFWHQAGFDFMTTSSGILEPVRAPEGMTSGSEVVQSQYGTREREWAQEHEGLITNWQQFEEYPWPTADDFDLSKWGYLDTALPSGMKAVFLLGKIYTSVWMFMGAEVFFRALENEPEFVQALFDKVGQLQLETFLRVVEHPCVGAVLNPDDIAHNTGLLVHPRHLRKYLWPWYRKMADVCQDKGIGFIFHSDGDCTEALGDIVEAGFHGFNPIQPNAMDIEAVKREWGDRLCLIGNLNLDSTLTLGSPQDVRAEVYERILVCGPGGGYMVASSNSVTDYVPLANMKAMFEATREFGNYPIELEPGKVAGKVWRYQGKGKAVVEEEPTAAAAAVDPQPFVEALLANDLERLGSLMDAAIAGGLSAPQVVDQGLVKAMGFIGQKFSAAEIYIPEMMLAARAMAAVLERFESQIAGQASETAGKVLIGTVKGDLHDIGKNLVMMMLKGQGFEVIDLGVNVAPDKFAAAVAAQKPDLLALSALLTTTMTEMKSTIEAVEEAGLRSAVKIIVGGAPVTQDFADQIAADGYAYDAPGAAKLCKRLLAE